MRQRPKPLSPEKQAELSSAQQKRAQKEFGKQLRAWERDRDAYQRQIDRQYTKQLTKLESLGIYEPKGEALTPYRKRRIRALTREFHEFLEGDYVHVKLPSKAAVAQAEALHFKGTRRGAFIPREGHTRVKVTERKGELYIDRSGKTKRGTGGAERRYVVERIPLRGLDELSTEKARLARELENLGPLTGSQRYAFVLTTHDGMEGYSRSVYTDIERMIADLEKYEKAIPWKQLQIFRHISIIKTESSRTYFREHPTKEKGFKKRKVNLKGRNV